MGGVKITDILKKYTMVIALILVVAFFYWKTGGKILLPQNINNLISQNAYVFVLAAGMLLCILTGGNIDLACGSVVCFIGGIQLICTGVLGEYIGKIYMEVKKRPRYIISDRTETRKKADGKEKPSDGSR